jgi:hypothetical protein
VRSGEANWRATLSHPESSEPITKDRNNCIKIGDLETSKSRRSSSTNVETLQRCDCDGLISASTSETKYFRMKEWIGIEGKLLFFVRSILLTFGGWRKLNHEEKSVRIVVSPTNFRIENP